MKDKLEQYGNTTKISIHLSLREKIVNVLIMSIVVLSVISPLSFIVGIALGNNLIIAPLAIIGCILVLIVLYKNYSLKGEVSYSNNGKLKIQRTGWRKKPIFLDKTSDDSVVLIREPTIGISQINRNESFTNFQKQYEDAVNFAEELLDKKIGLLHNSVSLADEVWHKWYDMTHESIIFSNYKGNIPKKDYAEEEKRQIKKINDWLHNNPYVRIRAGNGKWAILYAPAKSENILLFESPILDPNFIPFNNFAENIAEQLGIPLIDHTGAFPELIKSEDTDVSLKERVFMEKKSKNFTSEILPQSNSLPIAEDENGVLTMQSKPPPDGISIIAVLVWLFLFCLGIFILYAGSNAILDADMSLGWVVFGFVLVIVFGLGFTLLGYHSLDGLRSSWTVKISNEFASIKKKKLISYSKIKIPIHKIERLYVFEKGFGFGVELISDSKRIAIDCDLPLEDAIQLKSVIINRLVN